MDILFRDLAEKKGRGKELLVAYLSSAEVLKVKIILVSSVIAVADDRMAEVGKLRTDLMCSSGNELDFDIRDILAIRTGALIDIQYAVPGSDGKIPVLRDVVDKDVSRRGLFEVRGDFFHDGLIAADDICSAGRHTSYQTAVALGDKIRLKKSDSIFQAFLILGREDDPSGIHIDAVTKIQRRIVLVFS